MTAWPRDRREARDPREALGIWDGVPKWNIRRLMAAKGWTVTDAAREWGLRRDALSGWVNGSRHMPSAAVLHVADLAGVSPLYLLDLVADPEAYEVPETYVDRMMEALTAAERLAGAERGTADSERIEKGLRADWMRGDYRSLSAMAAAALRHYSTTTNPARMLSAIVTQGRART